MKKQTELHTRVIQLSMKYSLPEQETCAMLYSVVPVNILWNDFYKRPCCVYA